MLSRLGLCYFERFFGCCLRVLEQFPDSCIVLKKVDMELSYLHIEYKNDRIISFG